MTDQREHKSDLEKSIEEHRALEDLKDELAAALREAIATIEGMYDPADEDDPAPDAIAQWKTLLRRAEDE